MIPPIRLALVFSVLAGSAWAQNPPIQSTQLPPLQEQTPSPDTPRPVQPRLVPPSPPLPTYPNLPQPNAQAQPPAAPPVAPPGAPSPPATPPATAARPNIWVPAGSAKLVALDKVNAQATELTVKVGQSATFGSLTITVKACAIRPPDQPADATAYLHVTDSHPDSPGFDGWMLRGEPSVSMMQHPVYDLRVTGCT
jgi:hypothetical protein